MIKVDRTKVNEPSVLPDKNGDYNGEKQKSIRFFELGEGSKPAFNLYHNDAVKSTLHTLFNKKCAYCESIVTHVSHLHIEHWRPKGGVTGNPQHKGYYWLASEWNNLLLACGVCNGQGNKGNKFPLELNSTYALTSKDDYLKLEKPLLINPCDTNINPENYFVYNEFGMIRGLGERGKTSVEVYGLKREDLTIERRKWAQVVKNFLDEILYYISVALSNIEKGKEIGNEGIIQSKISLLKIYTSPEFQYSGMIRYIIRGYQEKYKSNIVFQRVLKKLLIEG